jgi:hypothetical protein
VDTAVDAIQTVNRASNAAQTANQAANVAQGAQTLARYADEAIQAGSTTLRNVGSAVSDAARRCSFTADTLVTTATGLWPIASVSVGDYVLAYHEESDSLDYYPVSAVWAHDDPVIVYLTIDGELVVTTPEHPFYTGQDEWLPAASLQVGDGIRRADWRTGTVEAISFTASPQTMYNFTVATAHTYFVGEGQWLVHNACAPPSGASRRLQPDPAAQGPHTTFRRDGTTGAINHYATWELNPRNPSGFDLSLRFDAVGPPHYNKVLGRDIPTPHIHSRRIPGGVGSASPNQIPHLHH